MERLFRITWPSGRNEASAIEMYTKVARQSVFIVVAVLQERRQTAVVLLVNV